MARALKEKDVLTHSAAVCAAQNQAFTCSPVLYSTTAAELGTTKEGPSSFGPHLQVALDIQTKLLLCTAHLPAALFLIGVLVSLLAAALGRSKGSLSSRAAMWRKYGRVDTFPVGPSRARRLRFRRTGR